MTEHATPPSAQRAARLCLALALFAMAIQIGMFFFGRDPGRVNVDTLNLLFYISIGCVAVGGVAGISAMVRTTHQRELNIRPTAITGLCMHAIIAGIIVWAFANGAATSNDPDADRQNEALLIGIWRGDYAVNDLSEPLDIRFDVNRKFRFMLSGADSADFMGTWKISRGQLELHVTEIIEQTNNVRVGETVTWSFQRVDDDHVKLAGRVYQRIASMPPPAPTPAPDASPAPAP